MAGAIWKLKGCFLGSSNFFLKTHFLEKSWSLRNCFFDELIINYQKSINKTYVNFEASVHIGKKHRKRIRDVRIRKIWRVCVLLIQVKVQLIKFNEGLLLDYYYIALHLQITDFKYTKNIYNLKVEFATYSNSEV